MKILGIESSCDETAASVIEVIENPKHVKILSSVTATSLQLHATTGGIIPEIAARNQIKDIIPVVYEALEKAGVLNENSESPSIDAIAVTFGPGLIGSLLVGVETAKTLSYIWDKPLIPINHLFGHLYANWVDSNTSSLRINDSERDNLFQTPEFPAIGLIISGGHTDLVLMKSHEEVVWLGGTRDDAAGECFDKSARLIGYNYPGGPKIAELAIKGNAKAFSFPRPMAGSHNFEFSFSGLKTAFLNATKEHFPILRTSNEKIGWNQIVLEESVDAGQKQVLYDLCASLQEAIIDVVTKKTIMACEKYNVKSLMIAGGVAANERLRQVFKEKLEKQNIQFFVPPRSLCTDNGTMIATAAVFQNKQTDWKNITANPELYFD